jgi:hypothetical protein
MYPSASYNTSMLSFRRCRIQFCTGASFKPPSQVTMTRNWLNPSWHFSVSKKTNSTIIPPSLSSQLHVTTVMTLRLAEKSLSRASGIQNFQPGPDQRSSSSFTINDRNPLWDSGLQKSQLPLLTSSQNSFT